MTNYDLKQLLETLLKNLNEGQLFSTTSAEIEHDVKGFHKILAARREEVKKALENHYTRLEQEINPLLDKITHLQNTAARVFKGEWKEDISPYHVKTLNDLIVALSTFDRLTKDDPSIIERLLSLHPKP